MMDSVVDSLHTVLIISSIFVFLSLEKEKIQHPSLNFENISAGDKMGHLRAVGTHPQCLLTETHFCIFPCFESRTASKGCSLQESSKL